MKVILMSLMTLLTMNIEAGECNGCKQGFLPDTQKVDHVSLPAEMVIYTDFACDYCKTGSEVAVKLKKKYGEEIKISVRAFPISSSESGQRTAKYYEAVRMLHPEKAFHYYKAVYQGKSKTEKSLLETAALLGMNKEEIDIAAKSSRIESAILNNKNEAARLNIKGVPTFVLDNRHFIVGAYPMSYFEKILEPRG